MEKQTNTDQYSNTFSSRSKTARRARRGRRGEGLYLIKLEITRTELGEDNTTELREPSKGLSKPAVRGVVVVDF